MPFPAPSEWFTHPGSVGKAVLGVAHVCDDEGNELPQGETGAVYFSGMPRFEYFKDPEKTRSAYKRRAHRVLPCVHRALQVPATREFDQELPRLPNGSCSSG